ncbi:Eco57I restriction-modification methylase domain-containing protein [Georgenia halophila]|uniref:site-specific DNA-methyltransferase (adenine-specific) n=1 Tax=Georgenia halophila TaxID=620889 RepID=A0ABP8L1K4_9MICO
MPFLRPSKIEAKEQMAALVDEYQQQASDLEASNSRYTETEARGQFIDRFLTILGWDVHNLAGQPQILRDVVLERISESDVGGRPDYRLRLNGKDRLPVEAKKPSVPLASAAAAARQTRSYGWSLSLPAATLTNMAETVVYDTTFAPSPEDGPDVAVVPDGRFTVDQYVPRFDDLWTLLSYESVTSDDYYAMYSFSEPRRGTSPFDRSFLEQFRSWRLKLARDIASTNPGLLADEVGRRTQRLLNALLFLRVCEDRNIGQYEALLKSAQGNMLLDAFRDADRAFNAGLFDVLQTTNYTSTAVASIIREMYWPHSKFAFGVLQPDVLAAVYEQYLAERVQIDTHGQVRLEEKPELTHAGGIVATPAWVVEDLVDYALEDKLTRGLPVPAGLSLVDLACGSGPFLIEAMNRLIEAEEEAGRHVGLVERAALAQNHLYGVDIDGAAVEVTRLSILLTVLGEEVVDPSRDRGLLPDLSHNLIVGNSLIEPKFDRVVPTAAMTPERRSAVAPLDLSAAFQSVCAAGGFDVVVGNPPYIRIQVLAEFMPDQLDYFQDARSGYGSAQSHNFDVYQLFVERAFQFLKEDGRFAYIVPNRFTNLVPAATMRSVLGPRLSRLVHFGDQQVFDGRMTYTAYVMAGPKTDEPAEFSIVSDLDAWQDSRACSTVRVDRADLTAAPWPVATEARTKVFEKMEQTAVARLGDDGWVNIFVGVQTSADGIFFIHPDQSRSTDEVAVFIDINGARQEVEWGILRPAVKDRTFEPYGQDPIPDSYVIFPYDVQPPAPGRKRGTATVYDEATMRARFPKALDYLMAHRRTLTTGRNVSPDPGPSFWAYGRSQSLTKLDEPKLIVRVLSRAPQYMFDEAGLVVPGGGDGGPYYLLRPDSACPYSIRVIQALMSHPAVDAYVASRGRAYLGAYIVHRKAFMASVPIPTLDDAQQQAIEEDVEEVQSIVVRLRTETDAALRTTLLGRMEVLQAQVNRLISDAYMLSDADTSAIVGD